jgi:hypothetical protein
MVEIMVTITETNSAVILAPVVPITPLRPFSRVTEGGPATEFMKELGRHRIEDLFVTASPVVVGPALDGGIEGTN